MKDLLKEIPIVTVVATGTSAACMSVTIDFLTKRMAHVSYTI